MTQATYTISTRTIKNGMIGTAKSIKEVQVILFNGEWFADVPKGTDAQFAVDHLNSQESN